MKHVRNNTTKKISLDLQALALSRSLVRIKGRIHLVENRISELDRKQLDAQQEAQLGGMFKLRSELRRNRDAIVAELTKVVGQMSNGQPAEVLV